MGEVLAERKPEMKARFIQQVRRPLEIPEGVSVPVDPQQALALGFRLGRSSGYGDGLVDGTELGLDVVLEAMDTFLRFPVFAWGGGARH
jgi:hypothetical protein